MFVVLLISFGFEVVSRNLPDAPINALARNIVVGLLVAIPIVLAIDRQLDLCARFQCYAISLVWFNPAILAGGIGNAYLTVGWWKRGYRIN